MVNRNLIREFDVSDEDWSEAIGDALPEDMGWLKGGDVGPNQIVEGRVLRIDDDFVLVDVGYKSEGIIPRNEWEEGDTIPEIGETIRVLVEDTEDIAPGRQDDRGMIVLSKRKAEKIEKWMKVMETVHENDVVSGLVTRKIKGGLLVDIGVNVFLPAIAGGYPPAARHRRVHRQRDQVPRAQDRRGTAQYSSQPPQPHRGRAGTEEERAAQAA